MARENGKNKHMLCKHNSGVECNAPISACAHCGFDPDVQARRAADVRCKLYAAVAYRGMLSRFRDYVDWVEGNEREIPVLLRDDLLAAIQTIQQLAAERADAVALIEKIDAEAKIAVASDLRTHAAWIVNYIAEWRGKKECDGK